MLSQSRWYRTHVHWRADDRSTSPCFQYAAADPTATYAVIVIDRDARSSQAPTSSPLRHFATSNVPGAVLKGGLDAKSPQTVLFAFSGPQVGCSGGRIWSSRGRRWGAVGDGFGFMPPTRSHSPMHAAGVNLCFAHCNWFSLYAAPGGVGLPPLLQRGVPAESGYCTHAARHQPPAMELSRVSLLCGNRVRCRIGLISWAGSYYFRLLILTLLPPASMNTYSRRWAANFSMTRLSTNFFATQNAARTGPCPPF